jgi:purine/pyrimidine-nucleoside phosphorylase
MIPMNEYFDGNVRSLSFNNSTGKFTNGVMKAGEYEFGTSSTEFMTLTSGKWLIKLPGASEFKEYGLYETYEVAANSKFQLKVLEDSAYTCRYL